MPREGGIILQSQGSGKSLIMVMLARWIREAFPDGRILMVTDRKELDSQIDATQLSDIILGPKDLLRMTPVEQELSDLKLFADPFSLSSFKRDDKGNWTAEFERRGRRIALRRESDGRIYSIEDGSIVAGMTCH